MARENVDYEQDKVGEMVLVLLHLAWKGYDWDVMDRLQEKGYISNPKGRAKSVALTPEGLALSDELFETHFRKK